jgi:hypothetical protein
MMREYLSINLLNLFISTKQIAVGRSLASTLEAKPNLRPISIRIQISGKEYSSDVFRF